jgi:hypothetical protein
MNVLTWTPEMSAALKVLRAHGEPLYYCAEKIGVSYRSAVFQARRLGIARRMNRGRRPGRIAIAQRKDN